MPGSFLKRARSPFGTRPSAVDSRVVAGLLPAAYCLLALLGGCTRRPARAELPESLVTVVTRAVDGDTFQLEGGERVRLLAVDAPESVHPHEPEEYFGKEAADFAQRSLAGERVRLVFDTNTVHRKHRDRYGRLLAYVYRERDNLDFNAELVKQGYAYAYLKYPTERGEEFLGYQREARRAGRGLWAPTPGRSVRRRDIPDD